MNIKKLRWHKGKFIFLTFIVLILALSCQGLNDKAQSKVHVKTLPELMR